MAPPKRPLEQRFWQKVEKTDGCWLWTASTGPKGYGQLWYENTFLRASRVSWEIHFGPIPDGLWVLHHCDNPRCVRPDHLYLGTAKENARDRETRKRHAHKVHRKFTWAQIEEVKTLRRQGKLLREIAAMYGVTNPTIHNIVTGKTYPKP